MHKTTIVNSIVKFANFLNTTCIIHIHLHQE